MLTASDSRDVEMIAEQLAAGVAEEEITQMLVDSGRSRGEAADLVRSVVDAESESVPLVEVYRRKMISGALWAIGGVAVTAITYEAARDGGVYIIAWGAMLFGAWDFIRGLFGYLGCSEAEVDVSCSNQIE